MSHRIYWEQKMRKLSLQNKFCVLLSWALMSMRGGAEPESFLVSKNLNWDLARGHCQVCYQDLVTLTPGNIQAVAQKLTTDSWIGLRKHFLPASNATHIPWSQWANGDPLTFQNWYPGHSRLTVGDPCVAMLSFGAWVEKNCLDTLPFICFEERFFEQANVTNVKSGSALLSWQPAPGLIDHYRVEVNGGHWWNVTGHTLTSDLSNLTAGALYSVKVFPVKCERDLNPQEVTFYTIPGPVSDLHLEMSYRSLNATWTPPAGDYSSFTVLLQLEGENVETTSNLTEPVKRFVDLWSGANYTVIVHSVSGPIPGQAVEESNFTLLLVPTNASVVAYNKTSLTFQWVAPENASLRYVVHLHSPFWGHDWSIDVENKTTCTFDGLTSGTRYEFEVRAVADNRKSEPLTMSHFTVAEERDLGLSILCSSTQLLECSKETGRAEVLRQLNERLKKLLGNDVFWKLELEERKND